MLHFAIFSQHFQIHRHLHLFIRLVAQAYLVLLILAHLLVIQGYVRSLLWVSFQSLY